MLAMRASLCLLFAGFAHGALMIDNIVDIPSHFRTRVVSDTGVGIFDADRVLIDLPGTPWVSSALIREDSETTADSVTVTWTIRHILGPHAGVDADPVPFNTQLTATATATGAGIVSTFATGRADHPLLAGGTHPDLFRLDLAITGVASRDITHYTVVFDAVHVPEPATAATVLCGLGCAFLIRWRTRRCKHG
jgi:hypothetical protein